ncbi:serine hydrolase domain-containing protein [Nocardioides panacihumi]|uniref:Serine hydrolase domain-containing protein n=1 Tax=Nocardioides panacihumi TaxID=400774 RepID=A0ABN2RX47_9ACTN
MIAVVQGDDHETLAYGSARLHPRRPMTDDTRFPIASVTKMMVATVVLQLVQEGKVRLDDTVDELLPGMLPFGAKVTVEDLLDHRSGILDVFNEDPKAYPLDADPTDAKLRQVLDHPPVDEPGTVSRYTNAGYWLLGKIIERATGHPLAAELRQRIFVPAGMTSTALATDLDEERNLAHGYDENGKDITAGDFSGPWAAGGVVSTVGDVATFFDQLFSGRLVPADVVGDMTTSRGLFDGSPNLGYGLGVTLLDAACGHVLGHFGDLPGFHTIAFRNPAKDRTVVEFVNTESDSAPVTGQNIAFRGICY